MAAKVELKIDDGVARIVLANPAGRNAVDLQCAREFAHAATQAAADPSVRAIVLQALGDFFCVGGDIQDFVANLSRIEVHVLEIASTVHVGVRQLVNAEAPFIVALGGVAGGGGFSLVCCADMVIAKRSARLTSAYTRSGLTPDAGATYFLPRLVGRRKAFEILAFDPTLTADEACALGLVNRVVEDGDFEAEIEKLMAALRAAPPGALAGLKRLLNQSDGQTLEAQLDAEARSIARQSASVETRALLQKFLAPRRI